jgi:hypothetical protein
MKIAAFFTSNGIPSIGLTPTIRIRDLSNDSLLVNDASMSESGDGWYKYEFNFYDKDKEYAIRCDGGVTLNDSDRYTYAGNENYIDDIDETVSQNVSGSNAEITNISTQITSLSADIANIPSEVWSESLSGSYLYATAGAIQQCILYSNTVTYDVSGGSTGTDFPIGTHRYPVNNIDDLLVIKNSRNLDMVHVHSDLTIPTGYDLSKVVFESPGFMGTDITIETNANVSNSAFRYVNMHGALSNGNIVLFESCTVYSFENFRGVMNNVSFGQGSEISFNGWATVIQGTVGGQVNNEAEFTLNDADVNMSHMTGTIKLKGKTGNNRTVINCDSANIIIDSTCVSGSIQLLGVGFVEQDNSGPNCTVDIDGFISNEYIADHVWDEELNAHLNSGSTGEKLAETATNTKIDSLSASNEANFTDIDNSLVSIENKIDGISVSAGAATPQQIAQAVWSENPSGYSGINNFGGLMREMSEDLKRLLGLTHENIFIDNPTYDADGNLTAARVRIYSNPASVGTSNNIIGTYQITAPSNAPGQFINWQQVRTS